MKSVLTPLAKSVLLPFGLSAAMSEAIQKNIHGSGLLHMLASRP